MINNKSKRESKSATIPVLIIDDFFIKNCFVANDQ